MSSACGKDHGRASRLRLSRRSCCTFGEPVGRTHRRTADAVSLNHLPWFSRCRLVVGPWFFESVFGSSFLGGAPCLWHRALQAPDGSRRKRGLRQRWPDSCGLPPTSGTHMVILGHEKLWTSRLPLANDQRPKSRSAQFSHPKSHRQRGSTTRGSTTRRQGVPCQRVRLGSHLRRM